MTPAELRMTLLLLAFIVGASFSIFFIRFRLCPPVAAVSSGVTQADKPVRKPASGGELLPSSAKRTENVSSGVPAPESPAEEAPPAAAPVLPSAPVAPPPVSIPEKPGIAEKQSAIEKTPSTEKRSPSARPESSAKKPVVLNPPASEPVLRNAPQKPASIGKTTLRNSPSGKIVQIPVSVGFPPPEKPHQQKHRGTIIFVFDDAGHNIKQLEPFLKLPFPCTIAVLPGLQYSGEAARRARAAGKEVLLHQPMQAINLSMDPGPGAIRKGMTPEQIKALVRKNLAEVGPVVGLNNHEGSLMTADRAAMGAVLAVVREKGIYFLDSRTNATTVAPTIARETNMTIWERAVFLDNSQDRSSIIEAVNSGMKIAERKGAAIMIGHIWSNDLAEILTGMYPELVSQGFSLSTIAQIATDKDGMQ